ncbi:MAG: hypothetical protein C0624_14320 [Desulfuromonas sp.]|nr:MAG: hypothetical protein C0624_14320 [Desulfuromonas sp.]
MRDHKPRAQKSQEYKQVIGLLVLVLAVAAVSFSLGVTVGKRSVPQVVAAAGDEGRQPSTAPESATGGEASAEDAPKVNLTFYETLPKGEETPLGSGINPPPADEAASPSPDEAPPADNPKASAAKPAATSRENTKQGSPKPPSVTSGEYVVQVASFKSEPDAKSLQNRLLGKGHRAFLQRVDLGEKGMWTRVYVGFYGSKASAQRVADRIAGEDKFSPMVRRRQ